MTELEFRNKVTWFSFALSLQVIWVHSYNAGAVSGISGGYRHGLCAGTPDWRVVWPDCGTGIFVISGYQFYRDFDWGKLKGKMAAA